MYNDISIEDIIIDETVNIEEMILLQETNEILYQIIAENFDTVEQHIIKMLYGLGCREYSQIEISKILNIPQYQVSRIKYRLLKRLKKYIGNL